MKLEKETNVEVIKVFDGWSDWQVNATPQEFYRFCDKHEIRGCAAGYMKALNPEFMVFTLEEWKEKMEKSYG